MKELKDKVYELEGLLELADLRPEKLADLHPLISARLEAINALWASKAAETPDAPVREEAEPEPAKPRIVLCLNDRFRFARIFGGDRNVLNRHLNAIVDAGNFNDARDYLIDDCGLDPDDPDVADLLEIVQKYFE